MPQWWFIDLIFEGFQELGSSSPRSDQYVLAKWTKFGICWVLREPSSFLCFFEVLSELEVLISRWTWTHSINLSPSITEFIEWGSEKVMTVNTKRPAFSANIPRTSSLAYLFFGSIVSTGSLFYMPDIGSHRHLHGQRLRYSALQQTLFEGIS